jgi:integrase
VKWSKSYRRWVGQATLRRPGQPPARKKVYGLRGNDSSAARQFVEDKLERYLGTAHAADGMTPLQRFLDEYASRDDLAPTTRTHYEALVKNHLAGIGRKKLLDVEPNDIMQALVAINGDRTRQQVRFLLRGVFQEAIYRQIIDRNPVDATRPAKYEPADKLRLFTAEQVSYLLKAASEDRIGALVPLSLSTTLGPAEMYGLQRRDLDLGNGVLHVERDCVEAKDAEGKYRPILRGVKAKKRAREVHLPPIAVNALREHLKRSGMLVTQGDGTEFVFTAPEGGLIRHWQLSQRWWKPLLQRAAKLAAKDNVAFPTGIGMYAMRHTAREIMSAQKIDYDLLSKRMGHSRLSTTFENYNKETWRQRDREAAERIQAFFEGLPRTGTGG